MASEMQYALDTNVVVAATIGPADRLWPAWSNFDRTEPLTRFVPSLVREEFYAVTEGIGTAWPGILAQVISDTLIAIRLGTSAPPSDAALAAKGITGNRLEKVHLLIDDFIRHSAGWDAAKARTLLRDFEKGYATRKNDFFQRHPVDSSIDSQKCGAVHSRLSKLVPGGGQSWDRDCEILAQVDHILDIGSLDGLFVTEDIRHIGRHAKEIVQLTAIQGIRNLSGSVY